MKDLVSKLVTELFTDHPMISDNPREILCFKGNGLRGPQKKTLERIRVGNAFEKVVADRLKRAFPHSIVMTNVYFVSGRYYERVKMYESIQIDIIMVTDKCVYVLECKMFGSDVDSLDVKSGTKNWRITMKDGRRVYHVNGCTQNEWHDDYLWSLLCKCDYPVPVRRITVIGGLNPNQISVGRGCQYDHLVVFDDLVKTIEGIENSINDYIDSIRVTKTLQKYEWLNPERELLHYIFLKKKRTGLPASWKRKLVAFN